MGWLYLSIAIVLEVVGTIQLKRTEGNFLSTAGMLMLLFYGISFFMLTLALKNDIEVGVGYAVWSGVGTALIAVVGVLMFDEQATLMKFLCISLIIVGVVGLKLNSNRQDASIEHQEKIEEAAEEDIGSASMDDLEQAVDEHVAHCVS